MNGHATDVLEDAMVLHKMQPGRARARPEGRAEIRCTNCNTLIFDGSALKSRVLVVLIGKCAAKCHTCKGWVEVPLAYTGV